MKYLRSSNSFIEGPTAPSIEGTNEVSEDINEEQTKSRVGRPSRRSKTTKMREAAVDILKDQETSIRGVVLQREIEERTGFKIANMTTFMNTIIRSDDKILKLGRGLYTYKKDQ